MTAVYTDEMGMVHSMEAPPVNGAIVMPQSTKGAPVKGATLQTFNYAAKRLAASAMKPDEILDKVAKDNPDWKNLASIAKTDEPFKNAFKDALVKDETLMQFFDKMREHPQGDEIGKFFAKNFKNPEFRGNMTLALQNIADRDDIKGEDMGELFDGMSQYDPSNSKASNKRIVQAMSKLGVPEEKSQKMILEAQGEFFKDILKNPQKLGGFLGNMLDQIGLPPQISNFIASFVPGIMEFIGNVPQYLSNFWNDPANKEVRELNENVVQPALGQGRDNINAYKLNFQ